VVHIPWPGQAHDRVQQQRAIHLLRGALRQFLMDPMQGVAGLKGDHVRVAQGLQTRARLRGGQPQVLKVVMPGQLEHLQTSRQVQRAPAVHLCDQGMAHLERAKDLVGDLSQLPGIDLFHGQHRQQVILAVTQGQVAVQVQRRAGLDGEGEWEREQLARAYPHLLQDALIVGLPHKAIERRKRARGQ